MSVRVFISNVRVDVGYYACWMIFQIGIVNSIKLANTCTVKHPISFFRTILPCLALPKIIMIYLVSKNFFGYYIHAFE